MINNEERELQRECGEFIKNNIIYCQSALIEECFEKEVFNYDDVINLYVPTCPECEDQDTEAQEIFEWWLVDRFMARKLEEYGEPILRNSIGTWWGRTTTGQAIAMDNVIRLIYKELKGGK